MKKLWLTALCAMPIMILIQPGLATGQSGGVQDGVKVGKVFLTGENPGIRLLDKENGKVLTAASYWRIVWSPVGPGHVCLITTGDGTSSDDLRVALTDNRKLYDYLTTQVLGTFDKMIAERPFTVVQATFNDPGQGTFSDDGSLMKERTVTSKADKYTVALVWRDFYEPFQLDTPVASGGPNPFGVTALFIPARSADVVINGKKAAGNVFPQKRGPAQSSSAFLAFSESWVGRR